MPCSLRPRGSCQENQFLLLIRPASRRAPIARIGEVSSSPNPFSKRREILYENRVDFQSIGAKPLLFYKNKNLGAKRPNTNTNTAPVNAAGVRSRQSPLRFAFSFPKTSRLNQKLDKHNQAL